MVVPTGKYLFLSCCWFFKVQLVCQPGFNFRASRCAGLLVVVDDHESSM